MQRYARRSSKSAFLLQSQCQCSGHDPFVSNSRFSASRRTGAQSKCAAINSSLESSSTICASTSAFLPTGFRRDFRRELISSPSAPPDVLLRLQKRACHPLSADDPPTDKGAKPVE